MEDDQHDLDLQIFIATGNKFLAATSCSYLQQPSLSPVPQSPIKSQESRKLWMPWCHWSPLVLHQQPGPHSFMLPHRVNRLSAVVPHRRALIDPVAAVLWKLIGCSFVLRRLEMICSSPGVKSTCTLILELTLTWPMAYVPIVLDVLYKFNYRSRNLQQISGAESCCRRINQQHCGAQVELLITTNVQL